MIGIEAILHPLRERPKAGLQRLERRLGAAHRLGRTEERRLPSPPATVASAVRTASAWPSSAGGRNSQTSPPPQSSRRRAASPSGSAETAAAPSARRQRDAPDDLVGIGGEGMDVRHLAPEAPRRIAAHETGWAPDKIGQHRRPRLDRRRHALQPQQRDRLVRKRGMTERQVRRPAHRGLTAERRRHDADRLAIRQPFQPDGRAVRRGGQHLHRHLAQHGERAHRTRHQLGQVEAGDVLDHLAAGREDLAKAVHPSKPRK